MVVKLKFNSWATDLVDIPAVSMPIARSLKTCDICGIVLHNKTAHFRVAFYCGQPKAHLYACRLYSSVETFLLELAVNAECKNEN